MPDPANYSSEDEWMGACVPTMIDEGKPQDQAVAACMQMWRDKALPEPETRAWSTLTIKSVDAEKREIEGIATTPTVDRIGDIVEPLGAKFTLPIPLLHHHRHDKPVGHVISAKATKAGISIKAKMARVAEAGELRDRVELAWQEIKAGLVRGLSIGFKPTEFEPLDAKDPWGGLRYTSWNWFELSLVTIPANVDAQISLVKSLDQDLIAASGNGEDRSSRPGAAGKPVKLKRKERETMSKTYSEQIEDLEATIAAKSKEMADIMAKAADEDRSTDADEQDRFDDLEREVEAMQKDVKRYRVLERQALERAQPVQPVMKTIEDGSAARAGMIRVRAPQLEPGIRLARIAKCLALAQGNRAEALRICRAHYASDGPTVATMEAAVAYGEISDAAVKAVVPAGSTTDTQWAGALVSAASGEAGVIGDFLEYLRPRTILGKFGAGGVPALRRVPFRTGLVTQHTGGTGYWVGEGAAKPVTKIDLSRRTLLPTKVANIAVVTEELLRDSSPSADALVREALTGALAERMDSDFIDPAITASGARPASITNGITNIISGGGGTYGAADQIRIDVRAMYANFIAAKLVPNCWIMSQTTALGLSLMQNPLGQPEFPSITSEGGTFLGLPVVVSQFVPASGSPSGDYIVLLDTNSIWFADEGGFSVDMSREATIAMEDAPAGAAFTGSPGTVTTLSTTALVSLWQENLIGWRAERTVNWARARNAGVQVLEGANWGEGVEP